VRTWYPNDVERVRRRERAITIARGRAGDPDAVPGLLALLGGTDDAVRRASAARLLAGFPTTTGVTDALVDGMRDPEPLVRAGAAWSLAQRPVLTPDARDEMEKGLMDPVRIVRLHAALGLRGTDPKTLPAATAAALARATSEWTESQEILADQPEAHYNLAIVLAARGDVDGAVAEYREALRLWPGSIQARHNLAMLLAQAGRMGDAEVEFRALLARDPVPQSAFALGLLYGQMGRWKDAVGALEQCLAEDPSYPRARYNLALALAKDGQSTKALDALELAAEDPASRREAILTLVDLARQVKDKARIEKWVLEAAKLDPAVAENPELQPLLPN
jgi:tetratricopeptide (TPR) repeat protein